MPALHWCTSCRIIPYVLFSKQVPTFAYATSFHKPAGGILQVFILMGRLFLIHSEDPWPKPERTPDCHGNRWTIEDVQGNHGSVPWYTGPGSLPVTPMQPLRVELNACIQMYKNRGSCTGVTMSRVWAHSRHTSALVSKHVQWIHLVSVQLLIVKGPFHMSYFYSIPHSVACNPTSLIDFQWGQKTQRFLKVIGIWNPFLPSKPHRLSPTIDQGHVLPEVKKLFRCSFSNASPKSLYFYRCPQNNNQQS